METLWQDLKYGTRQLARSPGFTAVAVVTLALGIGANTAIFSVVNAVFLRPPAVENPESLAWVSVTSLRGSRQGLLSYPDFVDFRDHNTSFSGFVGYERISVAVSGGQGSPERADAQLVAGDFFEVLGVRPAVGRTFTLSHVQAGGAQPVAVLSHSLWKRRFGSDPALLGQPVLVNGQLFTVVGIAPPAFEGLELDSPAGIWLPLETRSLLLPQSQALEQRDGYVLRALGRLKPLKGRTEAAADLQVIAHRLEQAFPQFSTGMRVDVSTLGGGVHPAAQGEPLQLTALLSIVTGLVLLIACANVANLLLVRAAGRGREVAIRLALGATRWRLLRQLTTESLFLSLAGGAAGLLAAVWLIDFARTLPGMTDSAARALAPNPAVFGYALLLSVLTGVFFGLVPALASRSAGIVPALKGEVASIGLRRGRSRLQSLFAVAQVSLSLVLLVGAGLFLRSLGKAALVDPGFEIRNGVGISFDLEVQGYSPEQREAFYRQLLDRVQALPGVRSASLAALAPLSGVMIRTGVTREGLDEADQDSAPAAFFNLVWPDYFRTMGIPLLRGR
ncbi:MAG: ABC transporter permease, partial [Acidobacteria bacterium]|nr:ABC transporter permease [Acidobacteriota bacterium]